MVHQDLWLFMAMTSYVDSAYQSNQCGRGQLYQVDAWDYIMKQMIGWKCYIRWCTISSVWDDHAKDMEYAVCDTSFWNPKQEETSDMEQESASNCKVRLSILGWKLERWGLPYFSACNNISNGHWGRGKFWLWCHNVLCIFIWGIRRTIRHKIRNIQLKSKISEMIGGMLWQLL